MNLTGQPLRQKRPQFVSPALRALGETLTAHFAAGRLVEK